MKNIEEYRMKAELAIEDLLCTCYNGEFCASIEEAKRVLEILINLREFIEAIEDNLTTDLNNLEEQE